jgi:membrane-bound metal-dependent hydrolase YbcI (DUF457 family)
MSWAAHDLEPYALQKHFGKAVAFVPLVIGSYAPDLLTKWLVYGSDLAGILSIKPDDPESFHRGWPGVGFTHSLAFGVAVALLIYLGGRNRAWGRTWALGFLIGQWAHALTDIGDTRGTMLLFPFSLEPISVGAWAYAGQLGRYVDAGAYFSGLGFVWDGVWVVYGLYNWKVLKRSYYREYIAVDPLFVWLGGRLPETALVALYRASFFYGVTRWTAWLLWAHVVNDYQFDLNWGGPDWAHELIEQQGLD